MRTRKKIRLSAAAVFLLPAGMIAGGYYLLGSLPVVGPLSFLVSYLGILLMVVGVIVLAVILVGWGIALSPTAPHLWAERGQYLTLQAFVTLVDVNAKDEVGETVVMKAAENGHGKIVKFLLARGAAVNEKNLFGQTALMLAQAKGHTAIVELLKKAGAME
jgi:hypothetical protein